MKKLGFGIIGCGEAAVQTAKFIARSEYARVARVQDVREDVATDLAEKCDAPYCLTWEELLSDKSVDAVYVATPHNLLAPAAIAAVEAGRHALVEKPMATTLADIDRLIAAADKARVAVSVAFNRRYSDITRKVKDLVDGGAIGGIFGVDFGYYTWKPDSYWTSGWSGRVETAWRKSIVESGGGIFLMNIGQLYDVVRHVTGLEAVSVSAEFDTFKRNVEVEDYMVATVRFDNGAIGNGRGASCIAGRFPPEISYGDRIFGLEGQIFYNDDIVKFYLQKPFGGYSAGRWHTLANSKPWGHIADCVDDFARAVLVGQKPPIDALQARKSLELCLAAYESGRTGRAVKLPFVERER